MASVTKKVILTWITSASSVIPSSAILTGAPTHRARHMAAHVIPVFTAPASNSRMETTIVFVMTAIQAPSAIESWILVSRSRALMENALQKSSDFNAFVQVDLLAACVTFE